MALPSQEEKELIQKFKEQVQDILQDGYQSSDLFLIRWIRARDGDLSAAESMLRNSIQWRKESKINELLASSPDSYYTKNLPYWLNGVDLEGRPVLCIPMGEWEIRKVVEEKGIEGISDYFNRMFERVCEAIQNYNARKGDAEAPITQFVSIVNWNNFSIKQTSNMKAVQSLLNAVSVYEAHYPEILGKAFFVNTNTVFQALFALMKPIFAPKTLGKITCYGTNRNEWEPAVRAVVEEHQLPRQFGG